MMKKGIIRPLVICLFKKGDTILVAEGYDPVKDDYYYRPIGGGELSSVKREYIHTRDI